MSIKSRKGDTLIEILFSITIFALVAVATVGLMNGGVYTAQKSLEITMARNEIDAQAEALRYIQNSYLAEKELTAENKQFSALWEKLTAPNSARTPSSIDLTDFTNLSNCSDVYGSRAYLTNMSAFVLNTRLMQPKVHNVAGYDDGGIGYDSLLDSMVVRAKDADGNKLRAAELYPRIVYSTWGTGAITDTDSSAGDLNESALYREIAAAQGIWVIAVRGGTNAENTSKEPEYFDFYIRTCWHSIGRKAASTIGTIIRLYNPEVVD